jgi:propionyl-CoA synthetase
VANPTKGEVPFGLVVPNANVTVAEEELEEQLVALVRRQVGPVA